MLRTTLQKAVRPAATRTFSTSVRAMAGETGSTRSGGSAQGDAFTKREKANEDYTIKMREKEKLLELRKRMAEQHEHLKKLEEHINDIERGTVGDDKK